MFDLIIRQAIDDKQILEFLYDGCHRVVEPHVYGVKNGTVEVLTFQIAGTSRSGAALPEWRRFKVLQISQLLIKPDTFLGPRPYPSGRHSAWDEIRACVT
jgi:hypothetical protein